QDVVSLVNIVDGVGQLTTAPVFQAVDLAAIFLDELGVALDHAADLLALVRVNQEDDFVMTHKCSLRVVACRACGQARSECRVVNLSRGRATACRRGKGRRTSEGAGARKGAGTVLVYAGEQGHRRQRDAWYRNETVTTETFRLLTLPA